jgi:hypothetical protein
LRLVRGGRNRVVIGSARVAVVPPGEALAVDAVVREEDTWQVLAAGVNVPLVAEHPLRLFTQLMAAEPLQPGAVLFRPGSPLTLLAVVYDFGEEPCCRTEWVTAALANILRICRERQLRSLLIPLLGAGHGRIAPEAAVALLAGALRESPAVLPEAVGLTVPPGSERKIRRLLALEGEVRNDRE